MLIPTKCSKYDPKTDKQYEHTYTVEEQRAIMEGVLAGKAIRAVKLEIISNLKDEDWIEV